MSKEFPYGDGDPNCTVCLGRGVTSIPKELRPPWLPMGGTVKCACVAERDLKDELNLVWRTLGFTKPVASSPLTDMVETDLLLTAPPDVLKEHLARVCRDLPSKTRVKVITDVDFMTTWLYSANEVFDGDVAAERERGENTATRITDLVEQWGLLVIRLGVKAARNQATPEVLLEVLNHRQHLGKPTWLVDEPIYRFAEGHISYDYRVAEAIQGWPTLALNRSAAPLGAYKPTTTTQSKPRAPVEEPGTGAWNRSHSADEGLGEALKLFADPGKKKGGRK